MARFLVELIPGRDTVAVIGHSSERASPVQFVRHQDLPVVLESIWYFRRGLEAIRTRPHLALVKGGDDAT